MAKKTTKKKIVKKNKTNKKDTFLNKMRNCACNIKDKIVNRVKSLTPKNYINIAIVISILVLSHYVFFQYKVIPFVDGQIYYKLALIIQGKMSMYEWFAIRGFSFPLIVAGILSIFGDSQHGLITGFYVFYLFLIFSIGYFIQKYIKINKVNNRVPFIILYLLLVVFNPLIIGWSHTLLIEAVMPSIYMIVLIICLHWYKINLKNNKKKEIIISIVLVLFATFIWFLKQPYAPAYYMAVLFTAILAGIYFKSWKVFLQKAAVIFCCLIFMLISIFSWDKFLASYTSKSVNDLNTTYMSGIVFGGLNVYYYHIPNEVACSDEYINNLKVSNKDKKEIKKLKKKYKKDWCSHIYIFEIKEKSGTFVTNEILIHNQPKLTLIDNIKFLNKNIIKHPSYVFRSYLYNYLAITDLQDVDLKNGYSSSTKFNPNAVGENLSNGFATFYPEHPTIYDQENFTVHLNVSTTPDNETVTDLLMINNGLCYYAFKLLLLLCFPIFIYTFIRYIKTKNSNYVITSLISLMCFTNMMFNVAMGMIIDRYVYALYPMMILCMFILFMEKKVVRSDDDENK